jgi:hypothetical protein
MENRPQFRFGDPVNGGGSLSCPGHHRQCSGENPPIGAVQIPRATSDRGSVKLEGKRGLTENEPKDGCDSSCANTGGWRPESVGQ